MSKKTRRIGRRSFLGIGLTTGVASLSNLPDIARAAAHTAKAKQVLVLFEQGGLSHIDTFDPKPDAVAEHRSPFKTISTNVPGMQFTELLTKTAQQADKLTVVRCMNQPTPGIGNSHSKGSQYIYSGEAPGGPVEMPDLGGVAAHRLGSPCRYLPPYIMVPGNSEQADQTKVGFLPPSTAVFKTGGRNLSSSGWKVANLRLAGIEAARFKNRADLLSKLDVGLTPLGGSRQAEAMGAFSQQAIDMLTNPATRRAFDFSTETDKTRDAYGRGHRGKCYLLGRKLIEAGVRFVTIDVREPQTSETPGGSNMNWDHHDFIYSKGSTKIKGGGAGAGRWGIGTWQMMGSTDQALSAILADMHERGLLEETLVCFVTEFGRTPKINNRKGRDHWVQAFSIAFAGAGVRGGQIVGKTDKDGGYITSNMSYTIEDYGATVMEKLGIDRHKPLRMSDGRPVLIAKKGTPMKELF